MYGVPKAKDGFLMRRRKEILLGVGSLLVVATIGKVVPEQLAQSREKKAQIEASAIRPAYEAFYKGERIGVVRSKAAGIEAGYKAYDRLAKELGYEPDIKLDLQYTEIEHRGNYPELGGVIDKLEEVAINKLPYVKEQAYVLRIGDDFTVALKDEQSVTEALRLAQKKFLTADIDIEVDLDQPASNSLVKQPKVLMLEPDKERLLLTSSGQASNQSKAEKKATTTVKQEAQKDKATTNKQAEKLLEVGIAEKVLVAPAYVAPDKVKTVAEAVELITKENAEKKTYTVRKGDCPGKIAEDNDMKLSELYTLNPGLKDKKKSIHVGDEVVVMVPEPEIKVETKSQILYEEPIIRNIVRVKDNSMYVGASKVVDEGIDGEKRITAVITKVNGQEMAREIVGTSVVKEAKNKIVATGTKPVPVKSATGHYITPLRSYRITSGFGYRKRGFHRGVDFAAPRGTPIRAADGGRVESAGWHGGYGYMVVISHGKGISTAYAHMSKIGVKVGQKVAQGQTIGAVGSTGRSTGPHVHFELRLSGSPVNPMKYLKR